MLRNDLGHVSIRVNFYHGHKLVELYYEEDYKNDDGIEFLKEYGYLQIKIVKGAL